MTEYKYIIVFDAHDKYKKEISRKTETLKAAYQFVCKQYTHNLSRRICKSNIDFYKKYPLDTIEKSIIEKGFYSFTNEDEIQTTEFYINNHMKEAL